MAHKFQVELAKSGRAACKQCKDKIDKDTVRFGWSQDIPAGDDGVKNYAMMGTKWYHFHCFPRFKGAKWLQTNLPDLNEVTGLECLPVEDQTKVADLWNLLKDGTVPASMAPSGGAAGPAGNSPGAAGASGSGDAAGKPAPKKLAGQKRAASTAIEELTAEPQGVLTDAEYAAIKHQKQQWAKKSVAQLKDMLKMNNLQVSGTKPALLERACENFVLGCLPVCTVCQKGKLQMARMDGALTCPGFYDEALGRYSRCKGPAADERIQRIMWKDE